MGFYCGGYIHASMNYTTVSLFTHRLRIQTSIRHSMKLTSSPSPGLIDRSTKLKQSNRKNPDPWILYSTFHPTFTIPETFRTILKTLAVSVSI